MGLHLNRQQYPYSFSVALNTRQCHSCCCYYSTFSHVIAFHCHEWNQTKFQKTDSEMQSFPAVLWLALDPLEKCWISPSISGVYRSIRYNNNNNIWQYSLTASADQPDTNMQSRWLLLCHSPQQHWVSWVATPSGKWRESCDSDAVKWHLYNEFTMSLPARETCVVFTNM